jgi:type I restriction enzyme M protein
MNGGRGRETVQKLWSASRSLQGGGVSYYEYLTELTYLLLLKMLEEVKRQGKPLEERLPAKYRWRELKRLEGEKRLKHYRQVLQDLGDKKKVDFDLVNQIYAGAKTSLTKAMALDTLVSMIHEVDWYAAEEDGLGDLYEGLLEKTTSERKSKAGQYFTPRPLIDAIIELVKPEVGKIIQDPAAGTGGFIIAAHRVILTATNDLTSLTPSESFFQRNRAYQGAELITDTQRLNTMNLLLHGIEMPLKCIDILSSDDENFEPADLILTNPPFNKFPERVTRGDFVFTAGGAKGPFSFVEHVVRGLKVGGRAAIVVPDNVLFEDNVGRQLRAWLMGQCDLHTILRLPTGIFYAQGVKTNVLFFTRRADKDVSATKTVWVYDMRAHMPSFGKTRPLTHEDFAPFIAAFGIDPDGLQHHHQHGKADPQHALVFRPVRARNHRRANPRQGRRLETEGHLDGRCGPARLPGRKPRPPRCRRRSRIRSQSFSPLPRSWRGGAPQDRS